MTRRGISDMTRFTPEEVQAKYDLTPAQYPDFAALRGDPSDNLPSIPGRGGEDRREVDPRVRLARRAGRPGRRGQGQGGRRAARAPAQRRAQPAAHRAAPRRAAARRTARPAPRSVGPRGGAQALRHVAVPGAARAALPDACKRSSPRPTRASRSRAPSLAPGDLHGWLHEHAQHRRAGRCQCRGHLGPRHRCRRRRRAGRRRRRGGVRRPDPAHRGGRARAHRLARRRRPAKALHDVKGPAARVRRTRSGRSPASRTTPRWPPTSRCRASVRSTWATWPCATSVASCAPREPAETGQLSLDGSTESDAAQAEMVRARAIVDLADALEADLDRPWRLAACCATWSCR